MRMLRVVLIQAETARIKYPTQVLLSNKETQERNCRSLRIQKGRKRRCHGTRNATKRISPYTASSILSCKAVRVRKQGPWRRHVLMFCDTNFTSRANFAAILEETYSMT